MWLEVFLLRDYNDRTEVLALIKDAILKISPNIVQLNTLDRPGTIDGLKTLTTEEFQKIKDYRNIPNVEIIASAAQREEIESFNTDIESTILITIVRRQCTADDLHQILGIHTNEINKYLSTLEQNKKIKSSMLDCGLFYELIAK